MSHDKPRFERAMDDTDTVKRLWRERGSTLITSIEAKEWGKSYRGDDSCTL